MGFSPFLIVAIADRVDRRPKLVSFAMAKPLIAKRARWGTKAIVLMGESLGTAIATVLAGAHDSAALVLDSPFSSAVDLAAMHYWMLPTRWLLRDRYRSDLAIGDVHAPVFVAHGDKDDIVPIILAQRLFDLANEPKTFLCVAGGGHLVLDSPETFPRVREWIDARTNAKRPRGHE